MFRLNILKSTTLRVLANAARVTSLAFILACLATTTAWAQDGGVKPLVQGPAPKVQPGQCTGNNTIRYWFLYTNGQIDSGLSTSQEISSENLNCVTFQDGDADLDAATLHLSCSEDYTANPTAPGNGLTVEDWAIYRPDTNGGVCGDVPFPGELIIAKETIPDGSPGSFSFSSPQTAIGNFSLSDGEFEQFFIDPGTYSVSETVPNGWSLDSLVCSDPTSNSTGNVNTATASIDLARDETVTCTYTNEKVQSADITIVKQTNPDGSQQSFNFTGDLGAFSLSDGQSNSETVTPGTYSVSETLPAGWQLTGATCDNGDTPDSITVADGDDVTCTFTNTADGSITVVKQTLPDGSQQSFNFTGDLGAFSLSDGQSNSESFQPGNYSVAETVPGGWSLTSATCDDGSNPNSINLAAGENVTCTFTNTQDGSITVVKQTLPDGSQQSFDFTGDLGGFQLSDGQSNSESFQPGNYSVAETVPGGWSLTSATCDDGSNPNSINLAAGENVTCTFTNTQDGSITVVKQTIPDGSQEVFDFTGDLGSFQLSDGQSNSASFQPGNYSVGETVPNGWELSSATCTDGSDPSSIDLAAGEDVTCTFNNTQQGQIVIGKQTNPDGSQEVFNFTRSYGGDFSLSDGDIQGSAFLSPGSYTATETVPSGWLLTGITCNDANSSGDLNTATANIELDAGETVRCDFTNTQEGSITVVKETFPDGSTESFSFTGDLGSFNLTDGQSETQALDPGTYGVSETVPSGWQLTSATCDDGSDPSEIDLAAGEDVTCTFENTQDGSITVVKQTDPDGSQEVFDFTGDLGSFQLSDGQSNSESFQPGTYGVSETVPSGWSLTSATCDDGSDPAEIDLAAGEDVTCTFENTQDGSITVVKQTDPDGSQEVFDFTGDLGSFQLSDGQSNSESFQPGTYGVSETVPSGWSLTSATCDDGSDPAEIDLAAGEDVTCTFENTQDGSITVVKQTDPDGSQEVFDFTGDLGSFQLSDGQSNSESFQPGIYGVSETVPAGWELTSASCDDGSDPSSIDLAAGEDVTCTFNNRQLEAGISVVKSTNGQPGEGEICQIIQVNDPVTWTYDVTNPGEQPLDITSITDDNGTPGNTGDDFIPTFTGGDTNGNSLLDPNETWTYEFGPSAAVRGEYVNTVVVNGTVSAEAQQPTAKVDIGTQVADSDSSRYCGVEIDLAIQKTDGGLLLVPEGGTFAYTLSYENLSTEDLTGVVITETVPVNTQFNAANSTAGWSCADGAPAGTSCTFTVGALAAGATGSVEFGLQVLELVEPDPETGQCPTDPPDFKVDNTASIVDDGQNGADVDLSNNEDSDDTPIAIDCEDQQQSASIQIVKNPNDQLIEQGGTANFTITVTNNGDADLVNVVVNDPLSPDCNRNIGDLASGASFAYNCERKVVTAPFTNVAEVTGETETGSELSDEDDARVRLLSVDEPQQMHPIPTMSQWGLILMAGLMLMLGVRRARVWTRR